MARGDQILTLGTTPVQFRYGSQENIQPPTKGNKMANAERLEHVLGIIEADLSKWDQASWGKIGECGTTYCLAGHAALAAGKKLKYQPAWYDHNQQIAFQTTDGDFISEVAMDYFDLELHEAAYLFDEDTDDFNDLKIRAKRVINKEI